MGAGSSRFARSALIDEKGRVLAPCSAIWARMENSLRPDQNTLHILAAHDVLLHKSTAAAVTWRPVWRMATSGWPATAALGSRTGSTSQAADQ
jgi:hypothetical protein